MAKAQKTEKGAEKLKYRVSRQAVKVMIPVTALSLTLGHVPTVFGKDNGIVKEIKKGPRTDAGDFKKWLEDGWKLASKTFGEVSGKIEVPGRITVRSVSRVDYELELSVDAHIETFPVSNGRIIIRALSNNSISIIYPDDLALSKHDAQKLASYAYLSSILSNAVQSEYATFYPVESLQILYSGIGTNHGEASRKCTSGEALAGFAAFFTDASAPMVFLGRTLEGDVRLIKQAVDAYIGKGAWDKILYAKQNGSTEIYEIVSRLEKLSGGKKHLSEYLSFMNVNFGLDAGEVKCQWNDAKGIWRTIGDAAK